MWIQRLKKTPKLWIIYINSNFNWLEDASLKNIFVFTMYKMSCEATELTQITKFLQYAWIKEVLMIFMSYGW